MKVQLTKKDSIRSESTKSGGSLVRRNEIFGIALYGNGTIRPKPINEPFREYETKLFGKLYSLIYAITGTHTSPIVFIRIMVTFVVYLMYSYTFVFFESINQLGSALCGRHLYPPKNIIWTSTRNWDKILSTIYAKFEIRVSRPVINIRTR